MLVSETFEKEGVCRNQLGHEFTPEYFEIWLRTEIARDKLMFYKQGLFKIKSVRQSLSRDA